MTKLNNPKITDNKALDRNDLVNRWGNIVSSFLAIPGLVGFWPFSSIQPSTGNIYDLSGQGRTLTYNGNPVYTFYNHFIPYLDFDGTGDFLSRADEADLDITGELTLGGWFWSDTTSAFDGLIGKWTESGNQRSYLLSTTNASNFVFSISTNGSSAISVNGATTFTSGTWYFVVGRFATGEEVRIYVNDLPAATATAETTIFNSNAALQIGAYNAGTQNLDGKASLCFLSAMALSDALIKALFQQSRILFGV